MVMEKQKAQIVCKLGRVLSLCLLYLFFFTVCRNCLPLLERGHPSMCGDWKMASRLEWQFLCFVLFACFLHAGIGLAQLGTGPDKQFDLVT